MVKLSRKDQQLRLKLSGLLYLLNERQRRILVAVEARAYGRGGVQAVARVTGMSRQTIYNGIKDLEKKIKNDGRVRRVGAGRKKKIDKDPEILNILDQILESSTRGDPESPLKWTCKSLRKLSEELLKRKISIGRQAIANLLHELDYSLQSNRKTSEGKADHPDRNEQFEYINKKSKYFLRRYLPVISVDTKKKELVGKYKNDGHEWQRKGEPVKVLTHDFPDPKLPKAVPYGVYDIGKNTGWVNVGTSSDTAEFAVSSIRYWWKKMGKKKYGNVREILVCADSGGSNGYRIHLWKYELQKFCNEEDLKITVCHFPPGTSKWNKIEHRLFSYISMNWRGRPLTDYRIIVNLIASTKTTSGLTVKVRLDKKKYNIGIKLSKEEIDSVNIKKHKFHGEWNYTLSPRK